MAFDASTFVDGFPPGTSSGSVSGEGRRAYGMCLRLMSDDFLQVGMDKAEFDKLLFHEYLSLMDSLAGGMNSTGECLLPNQPFGRGAIDALFAGVSEVPDAINLSPQVQLAKTAL
jgi:hypothetical protein